MKNRKLLALGLAAVMALGSLAGCGNKEETKDSGTKTEKEEGGSEESGSDEVVNIKIYSLCAETADHAEVMEALNEYTKEKIGITADWEFLGGTFADKVNAAITSGEEFDACFTSNWTSPAYNISVANGAFLDLTELLPEVAPDLWEAYPDYLWEGVTINGGIYAIPNQQIVARQLGILLPVEFLDAAGVQSSSITNLTNILDYAQNTKDEFGAKVEGPGFSNSAAYCGYEFLSDQYAAGVIKMDDETATVVNLYETDEWKSMLQELSVLKEKDLLAELLADEDSTNKRLAKQLSAVYSGTAKPGGDAEESSVAGYDCVLSHVDIDPYISTSSVIATMYAVSATSKHPEETLKYFQLIDTDPYAMNLLTYGIEGKHYEKVSDNVVKVAENTGYYQASWALGNVFLTYATESQPEDVWEQTKALNDSAKTSPVLGFTFDVEPVKNEIANMTTVVKEYDQLAKGQLSPEENDEFVEKLKVAGADTVIAEMQRQVDEFLAGK